MVKCVMAIVQDGLEAPERRALRKHTAAVAEIVCRGEPMSVSIDNLRTVLQRLRVPGVASLTMGTWDYMDKAVAERLVSRGATLREHAEVAVARRRRHLRARAADVGRRRGSEHQRGGGARGPDAAADQNHRPQQAQQPNEVGEGGRPQQAQQPDEVGEGGADEIAKLRAALKRARVKNHCYAAKLSYWKNKANKLQLALNLSKQELFEKTSLARAPKRKRGKGLFENMSLRGGYLVALKRNIGHGSSETVLNHLNSDFHATTVNRWERLLAISLIVQQRAWYQSHYSHLDHCAGELVGGKKCFSHVIHSIRGDATNSNVAHHACKAHVTEVVSAFYHVCHDIIQPQRGNEGGDDDDDDDDLVEVIQDNKRVFYADLQKVPRSCGSIEQRALLLKQFANVGARPWTDDTVLACDLESYFHIEIFIFGSDQGGDQRGAEKLFEADFNNQLLRWKIRQWCMQHSLHLSVKKQQARLNGGRHFGRVAKASLFTNASCSHEYSCCASAVTSQCKC